MPPDPGCYEERYRLTGRLALRLAIGLLSVGTGIFLGSPAVSATSVILAVPVFFSALTVVFVMPGVIAAASRTIAFRADYAGVTVSVTPHRPAAFRRSTTFIPWSEVDRIVLYPACSRGQHGDALVQGIAVQLQQGGTARARHVIAPGMARTITGWKLDRERLAAVTAAVAPGIPIVDTCGPGHSA